MPSETIVHVVDDDLAVRQSLSFLFASEGLPVRLHESASAFLDTVETPSGCIVTDVRMPGMDGIEFLRRLREHGFAVPVIVMTGHADVPMAVEGMKEVSPRGHSGARSANPESMTWLVPCVCWIPGSHASHAPRNDRS